MVEPAGGVFGVGEAPAGLPGSARATLAVTFNPRRAREVYAGVLRIRSDDPARKLLPFPAPVPGVFLVVSGMVGAALKEKGMVRPDVLVPGTGPQDGAVRNEKGHVIAVTRLKVATGAGA